MSYRDLNIWTLARQVSITIHEMTLNELPKFETYETGSQIRRYSKSIRSNIVEGYGRRHYRNDYLRFLIYAHASCDETIDHLETLWETSSLKNEALYTQLHVNLNALGSKLNRFIQSVKEREQTKS